MIIGERKCGTSSLYRYLITHPRVLPCKVKETHFFAHSDDYVRDHFDRYLEYFPSLDDEEATSQWIELDAEDRIVHEEMRMPIEPGVDYVTGEASANVLATVPPRRLHACLPDLKLVVAVRNPVDRAFSHYAMHQRYKAEGRPWFWLLSNYARDFKLERWAWHLGLRGPWLGPGHYIENIERWLEVYPRRQLFVVRTEDLEEPQRANAVMQELCDFLQLPRHDFHPVLDQRFNVAVRKARDEATARALRDHFEPYNRALESFLGRPLDW